MCPNRYYPRFVSHLKIKLLFFINHKINFPLNKDILLNSTNQDDLFQFSMNNSLDLNNNHKTTQSRNSKKTLKRTKSDDQEQSKSSSTKSNSSNMKRKRYRTSFKHQQLGVLKQYFQMNPNPDSKDLTVLSKRTGLQNRVLQVI